MDDSSSQQPNPLIEAYKIIGANMNVKEGDVQSYDSFFSPEKYRVREWQLNHNFGSTHPASPSLLSSVYFRGNNFKAAFLAARYLLTNGFNSKKDDFWIQHLKGKELVDYLLCSPIGEGLGIEEWTAPTLYE